MVDFISFFFILYFAVSGDLSLVIAIMQVLNLAAKIQCFRVTEKGSTSIFATVKRFTRLACRMLALRISIAL